MKNATRTLQPRPAVLNGADPLYLQLARILENMIGRRSLRPGDRMPSLRQFSAQQRVSLPTALHAYTTLESRGLIAARPKSGFYVAASPAARTPAPTTPHARAKVTDFGNIDPFASILADLGDSTLVPLGGAVPSIQLLPGPKLARTMAAVARRLSSAGNHYDMPPGSELLRRELARRSLEWGCALEAGDFIVTVAATEALSLALRVTCAPGDTVAVESPTYFGLARMLSEMRLRVLPIPVDSTTGLDLDCLKKALARTRIAACVATANFHNPVGSLMPDSHKKELVQLLATRGIPLIEDDVYGDLQHQGARPRCLKAYDPDGSVILCGSYSKSLAPGYRVGYIAGGRWHSQILTLKRVTTLGSATLPTLAIAEFLRNGGYDRYLRSVRQAYRRQVETMRAAVAAHFPPDVRLSRPQGGFLLWCELPQNTDSLAVFKNARRAGISVAPGPLFAPQGGFQNFLRLNCGYAWDARLAQSVQTLGQIVKRQA